MRKLLMLAALIVPTFSFAQQFQVGARIGFAPAMGSALQAEGSDEATKMSDQIKSQIPLQLDGFYKVNKDLAAGVYVGYGLGQVGADQCDAEGVDCSASVLRFGVQGTYTFNQVQAPVVPWAGVGLGYEMASLKQEAGGEESTFKANGFELNLQAGGDYKVNEKFSVGPYVLFSVGQYQNAEQETDAGTSDLEFDKKLHQWFGFGIAGKFSL